MKEKNLLPDNNDSSLEELTNQANQIIESLENEKDLNNSVERYQELSLIHISEPTRPY